MSTKNSQRIFSIILLELRKFYKVGGLILESTQDTTAVALPVKPV